MGKILGVPLRALIIASLFAIVASAAMLYPALADFGHSLVGTEDIKFFMWLFWHYENSLQQGTNPLFASEIFYPAGIWLSRTTIAPLPALLYLIMPQAWGAFGRITMIQLLSLVLGGILSFAFCYRLMKAAGTEGAMLPALLGSIMYNFSTFHLLSITHHLNYAMAIPFIPLFFIFYMDLRDKRRDAGTMAGLAASLFLISMGEITLALMLGLLVSIDIALTYMRHGAKTIGTREIVILFISGLAALVLSTLLGLEPDLMVADYVLPPAVFMASVVFLVMGADTALRAERELGLVRSLAIASIPVCAYMAFIFLLPSYPIQTDLALADSYLSSVPIQDLFIPTNISSLGILLHLGGLQVSGMGVYAGYVAMSLIALSFLFKGAGAEEVRLRDLMLISLLFAFPIVVVGDQLIAGSPFFPQTLFPILSVLRVPSRFILFAMFFASGCICLAAGRLIQSGWKHARAAIVVLAILMLMEVWPDYSAYMFAQSVPAFYTSIASSGEHPAIFLYPDIDYYGLLNEAYYQTIHGSPLSFGVVSRIPVPTDLRTRIYWDNATEDEIIGFVESSGFDYVVVQKTSCKTDADCFMGNYTSINQSRLMGIEGDMEQAFGKQVFEDDTMLAYKVIRNQSS